MPTSCRNRTIRASSATGCRALSSACCNAIRCGSAGRGRCSRAQPVTQVEIFSLVIRKIIGQSPSLIVRPLVGRGQQDVGHRGIQPGIQRPCRVGREQSKMSQRIIAVSVLANDAHDQRAGLVLFDHTIGLKSREVRSTFGTTDGPSSIIPLPFPIEDVLDVKTFLNELTARIHKPQPFGLLLPFRPPGHLDFRNHEIPVGIQPRSKSWQVIVR